MLHDFVTQSSVPHRCDPIRARDVHDEHPFSCAGWVGAMHIQHGRPRAVRRCSCFTPPRPSDLGMSTGRAHAHNRRASELLDLNLLAFADVAAKWCDDAGQAAAKRNHVHVPDREGTRSKPPIRSTRRKAMGAQQSAASETIGGRPLKRERGAPALLPQQSCRGARHVVDTQEPNGRERTSKAGWHRAQRAWTSPTAGLRQVDPRTIPKSAYHPKERERDERAPVLLRSLAFLGLLRVQRPG